MFVFYVVHGLFERYLTNKEWRDEWGGKKAGELVICEMSSMA